MKNTVKEIMGEIFEGCTLKGTIGCIALFTIMFVLMALVEML